MPTLLETQRAMRASLVDGDRAAAAMLVEPGPPSPRHLPQHLRRVTRRWLTYPDVHRLVGADFFGRRRPFHCAASRHRPSRRIRRRIPGFLETFTPLRRS